MSDTSRTDAVESETPRTDDYLFMSPRASSQAWEELFLHAQTLERELAAMTKERDSARNEAITEVIALVASGKGDDQALLRQRIRALKRKEQP